MTFQTVLVTSVLAENGVTEEQTPGFKGAFLNGLERIAPDIEEATGEHVGGGRGGGEAMLVRVGASEWFCFCFVVFCAL